MIHACGDKMIKGKNNACIAPTVQAAGKGNALSSIA